MGKRQTTHLSLFLSQRFFLLLPLYLGASWFSQLNPIVFYLKLLNTFFSLKHTLSLI
jgi:hypothetical protein